MNIVLRKLYGLCESLSPFASKKDLSDNLTGHLLGNWLGGDADGDTPISPEHERRIANILEGAPTLTLDVQAQLARCKMLDPQKWKDQRAVVFGYTFGRCHGYCEYMNEKGEQSIWAALLLTIVVLRNLHGRRWNEEEVTAALDRYLTSNHERFQAARKDAYRISMTQRMDDAQRLTLVKYLMP